MSACSSQYIRLAQLSARHNIEADPEAIRLRVYAAINKAQVLEKRLEIYQYNKEAHELHDNFHNALRSKGCGCVLCTTRHTYCKLKYERKQFQRSYESSCDRSAFLKMYTLYSAGENSKAFYSSKMAKYGKTINELKARIKAIEETYGLLKA